MITTEEYEKSLGIVNQYLKEQEAIQEAKETQILADLKKKHDECDDHYYLPSGPYLSSKRCQFCGKTIH